MHPTDDEFLHQAQLCRNIAANAVTEELKVGWLRLAAEWQSMIAVQVPAARVEPFDLPAGNGIPAQTPASR